MTAYAYTKESELGGDVTYTSQSGQSGQTYSSNQTGQVKNVWGGGRRFSLIARGLSNLRGKDSGTIQDYENKLVEYHYLRVKTMQKINEGDIIAYIEDANGEPYLDANKQFVVVGVTPTFDPFGSFVEYDILCDEGETRADLSAPPEFGQPVHVFATASDSAGATG